MKLIDTHCHIDNEMYDEDREILIKEMEKELELAVNIGYDIDSTKNSIELAKKHDFIYATAGIHPCDIKIYSDEIEAEIKELAKDEKVIAIGEIGLDYYWMNDSKEDQQIAFRRQLEIAKELNLPVVIHTRDSMEDTINILKEYPTVEGIMHCYPGSFESAKQLMDRFYFGYGGVVTFKNAKNIKKAVTEIPLERIIVETDSPYLTPAPYRGKRNSPTYVKHVAEEIARLKEMELEEVVKILNENAKKAYRLGE